MQTGFVLLFMLFWCRTKEHNLQRQIKILDGNEYQKYDRIVQYTGFHVFHPIARVNVDNRFNCLQICAQLPLCRACNFLWDIRTCTLHGSKPKLDRSVVKFAVLPAVSYVIHRVEGLEIEPSIRINPGFPGTHCGIPYFPNSEPAIGSTQRYRRILGGFTPSPFAYPWIGVVVYQNINVCGVSLVNKNIGDKSTLWALSAAHCFHVYGRHKEQDPVDKYAFLFGAYDLRLTLPHTKYRRASFIILHPKYDGQVNDIAVIKLVRSIGFNFYIRPLCLPENLDGNLLDMQHCLFCGFGSTNFDTPSQAADQLMCIDSPTPMKAIIINLMSIDWKSSFFNVWRNLPYKGPYYGDSGSSFFCKVQSKFVAEGVMSGGDLSRYKAVHLSTKVSHCLKWISESMDDNRLISKEEFGGISSIFSNFRNRLNQGIGARFSSKIRSFV